jgi:hypothetical protein
VARSSDAFDAVEGIPTTAPTFMTSSAAGLLMIAGSVMFLVGAGVAVPQVFTEPDREERERMLEERLFLWRLGQPLYAVGALVAAVGVGVLAADGEAGNRAWLLVSCGLLVLGALAWSWSVYLRAARPRDFASGSLPGWPFASYVGLTIAGLFLLGVGIWPGWLAWLTLTATALFLVAYLRYRDIPPFVLYLLLLVVGVAVL